MQQYKVKERDTLWKIARKNRTTVDAIAALNGLKGRQIHNLKVDQILLLPGDSDNSPDSKINLKFRGIDTKTFTPQQVKVEHDGTTSTHILGANASIMLAIYDHTKGLRVWIEDLSKKMESVLAVDILPIGDWNLNIDSRVLKTAGSLQPKAGAASSSSSEVQNAVTHNAQVENGQTKLEETRVEGGKPVQVIATIYTSENLRLHPANEKYRAYILDSAKRYQITPQALAAMIQAETLTKKSGEWDEKTNENAPKQAQGLCQFFAGGWQHVYCEPGTLLNADCKGLSESNLLAKRLVAKYAIDSLGAYAKINIRDFENASKLDTSALPPEEKAKLAYLLHHEGVFGTRRLLGLAGSRTNDEWFDALTGQLGIKSKNAETRKKAETTAKQLVQQYGNAHKAYRGWLFNLTDSKINVNHFVVNDPAALSTKPRTIAEITSSLTKVQQAEKPAPKPPKAPAPPPSPPTSQPAPASPATEGWHDPLATCTLRTANLASKKGATFGMVRDNGAKPHQGIDLCAVPGTPIFAVADGIAYPYRDSSKKGYGNTLILEVDIDDLPDHQADLIRAAGKKSGTVGFVYAHLDELPAKQKVFHAGEVMGKSGHTGNADNMTTINKGAHLHFEVRLDALKRTKGLTNRIDPLPFINNCTNR
jgi:murein DD-endopeptidase MepM/ murein hydrolase activator NlpD